MKILVAIANHGTKNRNFLERLLAAYRTVRHEITIVVLSDRPKGDLPPDVEVLVGAPTSNPRSLPFAHRRLFAERVDSFDLFIYSEDDTLIEERHIEAFLRVKRLLPDDEIPGFMRYELRSSGERSYCSVHSHYRWDTRTVQIRGGQVFATFTNQHSACHMMTKEQLRKAIDSGGFLVPPHEGAYGMLESAATDPYIKCGFKRRIAVSQIEDFLLHHLPNIYLDKLGISPDDFYAQLEALRHIAEGRVSGDPLFDPDSKLPVPPWGLQCYPRAFDELRRCVPDQARTVLTVGSTAGILERELFGDAATIVGIPVDNALAAVARRRNIEVTPPDWAAAMRQVQGRVFDVVLLYDVLHRFPEPERTLRDLRPLLGGPSSRMVITLPNLWHYRLRKAIQSRPGALPRSYSESGMYQPTWPQLRRWLGEGGLSAEMRAFRVEGRMAAVATWLPLGSRAWLSEELLVRAKPA